MALTTLYKDAANTWSVEEEREGRLWLDVSGGSAGLYTLHHELTPGEKKEFRESPENLEPLVRRICARPKAYRDQRSEAEYRRQSGG